jgi:DNA-binding winged helix-turn-helix (wHTH) protein
MERDELMNRLWPDSFIEESSLAQNIFQLRKALEEGTSGRQYIETVPKRGYGFAASVRYRGWRRDTCVAVCGGRALLR